MRLIRHLFAVATFAASGAVWAGPVFSLLTIPPVNSFTKSNDGVSGLFKATVSGDIALGTSAGGNFSLSNGGLFFGNGTVLEFTLKLDTSLFLTSIAGSAVDGDTFDITGPGVSSPGNSAGASLIGGPLLLQAGVDYTFSTLPAVTGQGSTLTSMTFERAPAVVPEPPALALLVAALGAAALTRRRS